MYLKKQPNMSFSGPLPISMCLPKPPKAPLNRTHPASETKDFVAGNPAEEHKNNNGIRKREMRSCSKFFEVFGRFLTGEALRPAGGCGAGQSWTWGGTERHVLQQGDSLVVRKEMREYKREDLGENSLGGKTGKVERWHLNRGGLMMPTEVRFSAWITGHG